MKHTFYLLALASLCIMQSCDQNGQSQKNGGDQSKHIVLQPQPKGANNSQSITIDEADTMIKSYLKSIHYEKNDTDLRSLIFNADSLRKYLNDTSKGKIAFVKLMFAHTPEYIKNGGEDINCGYRSGALTLVVAGYDNKNNYIYNDRKMVIEHAFPCPANCPTNGTASDDLLPVKQ